MESSTRQPAKDCADAVEEFVRFLAEKLVPDHLHQDFLVQATHGAASVEVNINVRDPSEAAGRLTGKHGVNINAIQDLARAVTGARFGRIGTTVNIVRVENL